MDITHYQRSLTYMNRDGAMHTESEKMPFDESIRSFHPKFGIPLQDALMVVNEWNRMSASAPNVEREGYVRYHYWVVL